MWAPGVLLGIVDDIKDFRDQAKAEEIEFTERDQRTLAN